MLEKKQSLLSLRNITTALGRIFSKSKPGEFSARNSIETGLTATKRDIATRPIGEPTQISKKGFGVGSIFAEEGLGHNYHKYLERETLRHARYVMYDRMDTDLIASALDVYANEGTQKNQEGKVIGVYSSSKYIQEELRSMLEDTGMNNYMSWSIFRDMCKYGDHFISLKLDSFKGVVGITDMNPISIYRLEEEGDLVGFVQDLDVLKSAVQNASIVSATMNPYINLNTLSLPYMTGDNAQRDSDDSLITFLKYELIHFKLRGKGIFIPYGCCLEYNTRVETELGYKEIKDIVPGDKVWSLDNSGNKIISNVLDVICSGKKQVYGIATTHNFISVSKEHRIMVVDKSGNFTYKYPTELNIGDLLAIATKKEVSEKIKIDLSKPEGHLHNGYWSTTAGLPNYVDEDFARLFGFMLGDGWIHNENAVCFAAGVHPTINNRYIDLLEKYSGGTSRKTKSNCSHSILEYDQVVCGSKMLVTVLRRMGFCGKATTKRLPNWIFSASEDIRKAFLSGLIDADGSLFIDRWNCVRYSIELSNEELIRDVKTLVQSLGLKSGKLSTRDRTNKPTTTIDGRLICSTVPSWQFYFFDSEVTQAKTHDVRKTKEYILEPIRNIVLEETETETWDVHVDSECHNFYANGIVVHNSVLEGAVDVWKKLDLLFDSLIIYRLNRAPTRLVFYVDVGNNQGADVENIVKRQINALTKKEYFNPNGKLNERYQLLDMNANLFIPIQKGSSSKIEKLEGSCFALDTKVPLLDGRILELNQIIKEYDEGKENWVYSCNPETGEIVPGPISWAGVTRINTPVMTLVLDNGEKITCTPDHKFPVFGKVGKTEASDIKIGDSLFPFTTKLSNETNLMDYEQVYDIKEKKFIYTHRMVAKYLKPLGVITETSYNNIDEKRSVIHHIDMNKKNNNPQNLTYMGFKNHRDYHTENNFWNVASEEAKNVTRKKKSDIAKKAWENMSGERKK